MQRTQNGFGHVVALIVIILVALGGIVFAVIRANDTSSRTNTNDGAGQSSVQESAIALAEYRNDGFGFTLSYPEVWGKPRLSETDKGATGSAHNLSWEKKSVSFTTSDYTPPTPATGGAIEPFTYDACSTGLTEAKPVKVYADDITCVVLYATETVDGVQANMLAQRAFDGDATIDGLRFEHAAVMAQSDDEAALREAYGKQYLQQFVDFVKSAKQLN